MHGPCRGSGSRRQLGESRSSMRVVRRGSGGDDTCRSEDSMRIVRRGSVRRQLGESRSSMRIVRRGSVVEEVLNDAPMGSVRVRRRGSRVAAEDVRAGFRSSKAGRQVACKCNAEAPMGSVEDDDDGRSRRGSFRR